MQKETKVAHSGITRKFRFSGQEIVFRHGAMGVVYDTDNHAYIDLVMGYGPVILGHGYPPFQEKLYTYLKHGLMMPSYTIFHQEYLSRLLKDYPYKQGAIFKTASEAVTAAFRMAAMKTQRLGIIRCGYVGWHDAQIGMSIKWHEPLHSPARERLRYTDFMRGISGDEPALNWVDMQVESFRHILETYAGRIGCFIIDAYLMSFTTLETIQKVISLCHEHGVLVIFDETKTGGRISKLGYAHDHQLAVDLVVIGKALANGAPISIVIGRDDLLEYAVQARLSGTFSKEMFTIYAALATLELMEQEIAPTRDGWQEIGQIGQKIAEIITAAAVDADVREHLWAQPVLGGGMFELCYSDWILPERKLRQHLLSCLAEHGVLLLEGHPSFVCLAHRETDWAHFQQLVAGGLNQWKQREEFYGK